MAGRATTPQGRKLGNINNMPNRRYLPSINFSVPFAKWSHFYVSIDWNSFFEFKHPQDSRFRLRTTHWKISDKDLTDACPSNVNINLDQKFGKVKKCHNTISEDKLVFQCEECNRNFKNENS
jgi:hypothetical protein